METFSEHGMRATMGSVNGALGKGALDDELLAKTFEKWWPDLGRDVQEAQNAVPPSPPPEPSERDLLVEILTTVRVISEQRKATAVLPLWAIPTRPSSSPYDVQTLSDAGWSQDVLRYLRNLGAHYGRLTPEERRAVRRRLETLFTDAGADEQKQGEGQE
jgi:hypothetical protein